MFLLHRMSRVLALSDTFGPVALMSEVGAKADVVASLQLVAVDPERLSAPPDRAIAIGN